ncbi:MAG: ABC transporter ATP-binding protein, partial [Halodesulfurarchaeum sp.]
MSVVAVEELTVRGTDETALVRDVSLSIEDGETVLLAGPSGSGKTLLGTAIAGLLADKPGLSVTGQRTSEGVVGLLMQNPRRQLVRERVRADVAFGLENRGVEPARIHDRIGRWANRLSVGHLIDRKIDSLSRGETTLVALLGALVTDPDLMVLD